MKNFILFFLTIFLLNFTNLNANISINSKYLLFDDKTRNNDLTVINASSEPHTYKISFIYYKQNADGSYVPNNDISLIESSKYLKITPRQFTLKPSESQVIRIQKTSMADSPDKEYDMHMLIKEQPEEVPPSDLKIEKNEDLEIKIKPLFAVSFPVIVRKGKLEANNSITETNFFVEDNIIKLKVKISREGNRSSRGDLILKNNKDVVAKADGVNIFLSNNLREFTLNIGSTDDADLVEKLTQPLTLLYQDSFNKKNILAKTDLSYKK